MSIQTIPLPSSLAALTPPNIRITSISVTRLSFRPQDGSFVHECGPVVLTKYDVAIVEIHTDAGIVGIGPGNSYDESDLSHFVGCSPFDLLSQRAPAGVNVACWDIVGKALGQPVFRLLAGDRPADPRVKVYASGGVLWTYYDKRDGRPFGADALIEEALRYRTMGFDTFKWRPGTDWEESGITPATLGDVCRRLREAVGPDFQLGLEKKGYDAWTFEQCMEIAPILDDLEFLFFEQPMMDVGPGQFDAYRRIRARMPRVQLWGGESFLTFEQARPWIEQRIYDAVQSDSLIIGVSENRRIAEFAADHHIDLVTHNWASCLGTMANLHTVAGTRSGRMCEFFLYPNPFREALVTEPYRPVNGVVTLTEAPGFGMTLAPDLPRRFPFIPGPAVAANPRFPHAWARAQARERAVVSQFS